MRLRDQRRAGIDQPAARLHGGERDGNPLGKLEELRPPGSAWVASGWALDVDSTSPIFVDVLVDGKLAVRAVTKQQRPVVGAIYPGWGGVPASQLP